MKPIEVTMIYDLICPWCWIAEHRLAQAIDAVGLTGNVNVRFVPFELNPSMPAGGMDRKAYRSAKFGSWARSQALDAHVAEAGRAAGLVFDHARIARTPNTRLAHRLVWFAQQRGSAVALVDALFAAYFRDGRDIGDTDVLAEIATGAGLPADAVRAFLASDAGLDAVVALEAHALGEGVASVPSTRIGQSVVSGAQPAAVFRDALIAAQRAHDKAT
ncbi:DsbA family oxidoreductase [Burkholderia multivorans]|uniref:DsbA family oxidoreductase n=1 Tax=Burkholderia multivorans TaxID=87883 RepID=UPI001C217309|nr:DsbA family oxidoreductase [Burkholderia multivorans]MBU9679613.1 DsbA family oxidoreductase [Burkholderia multivorans]MCA8315071.1 DsbA family oxidoreductase [Burkholderia multivorans]MDN8011375.1 DsbA family oxidoreductase [Burkholderia multivorans]